jgi:hypothetical protein
MPGIAAPRAVGGASRTGLVSMLPMVSPSAVMSSRERANPAGVRFAGRRRNMPSKSTIPASLSLSRQSGMTFFECHPALSFCLSMIFSENRYPLFRIMLQSRATARGEIRFAPANIE